MTTKERLTQVHAELMRVKVSGEDIEHMYRALTALASIINSMPEQEAPNETIENPSSAS